MNSITIVLIIAKILGVTIIAVVVFAGHLGVKGFQEVPIVFSFVFFIGSIVALSLDGLLLRKIQEMADWYKNREGYR